MGKFTIVSVDMFGTLADFNTIASDVWKIFLKESYTEESVKTYWERANQLVFKHYDQAIQEKRFCPPEELFRLCYTDLFQEFNIDFNPDEAAQVLAYYHSQSIPFADAKPFLQQASITCRVCLSSDTSEIMLGQLRYMHPFDMVFTSEQIGSFKTGPQGTFFTTLVKHYQEDPGNIVHIGDQLSDIQGAHEAGITACWLNRTGKAWSHEIIPDYEIRSLDEAVAVLELDES